MNIRKSDTFIRSSKCSLKFNNSKKQSLLKTLLEEYNKCLEVYIDFLWSKHVDGEEIKMRFLKKEQPEINTFLTARLLNSCINQASSIVRSRIEQTKKYQKTLDELGKKDNLSQKQLDYKSLLTERIGKMNEKPVSKKREMRIDSKNSKIELQTNIKTFDIIVEMFCLGMNKFNLVAKRHQHFNKLIKKGHLLSGIIVSDDFIQFNFEYKKEHNDRDKVVGIDIGINTCLTTSDNERLSSNDKGKSYHAIMNDIVRKKKGSKAFDRKLKERDNCTHYCVNKLDWNNLSEICIEDIKNLRQCKKTNKIRRHWNYRLILDSLKSSAEEHNVYVNLKNPMYTSQRCSSCGYVKKENRQNESFICLHCGFAANADYNASINLSHSLPSIKRNEIPKEHSFFWDSLGIRLKGEESEAPLFTK